MLSTNKTPTEHGALLPKAIRYYFGLQLLLVVVFYIGALWAGHKTYSLWPQVSSLAHFSPLVTLSHAHGLRYLLTYPVFVLADSLAINRDFVFGFFVTFNLMLSAWLLARFQSRLSPHIDGHTTHWLLFYLPIFLAMGLPMNGRLSYLMLGAAAMLLTYQYWIGSLKRPKWSPGASILCFLATTFALTLLSISSGSLTVALVVTLFHSFVFLVLNVPLRRRLFAAALNTLSTAPFISLQLSFIQKNLDFYGGSFYTIIMHGPGAFLAVLNPSPYILAAVLGAVAFIGVLILLYSIVHIHRHAILVPPVVMTICALIIGMTGYTTLLTGLLAAMALGIHVLGYVLQQSHSGLIARVRQHVVHSVKAQGVSKSQVMIAAAATLVVYASSAAVLPADWRVYYQHETTPAATFGVWVYGKTQKSFPHYTQFVPKAFVQDDAGNQYIVDDGKRIVRFSADKKFTIYAGENGEFQGITDIALGKDGTLYVADAKSHEVKKVAPDGSVSTVAGNGNVGLPYANCIATQCPLNTPSAIALLNNGDLIIIDTVSQIVVKLRDGRLWPHMSIREDRFYFGISGKKAKKLNWPAD